jgi:hypothetical protein
VKSRATVSKEKELVVSDDDKPPTRSASTQPQTQSISVRNISARPAPYIHRDIDPADRAKFNPSPARSTRPHVPARFIRGTDAE